MLKTAVHCTQASITFSVPAPRPADQGPIPSVPKIFPKKNSMSLAYNDSLDGGLCKA